jgi:hypothetical protein
MADPGSPGRRGTRRISSPSLCREVRDARNCLQEGAVSALDFSGHRHEAAFAESRRRRLPAHRARAVLKVRQGLSMTALRPCGPYGRPPNCRPSGVWRNRIFRELVPNCPRSGAIALDFSMSGAPGARGYKIEPIWSQKMEFQP